MVGKDEARPRVETRTRKSEATRVLEACADRLLSYYRVAISTWYTVLSVPLSYSSISLERSNEEGIVSNMTSRENGHRESLHSHFLSFLKDSIDFVRSLLRRRVQLRTRGVTTWSALPPTATL